MTTTDVAVRGISENGAVRAIAAVTTELADELQKRHGTWPVATAALGRTATISGMMGLLLKGDERLTVQLKGDGPIGSIVVDADAHGHVRGYVDEPHVHLPSNAQGKLDVGGAVGQGMLYVMRDLGMKDVYRGSVELQTGEIADDFTYYFVVSEQTPSAVGAGVLVDTDNSVITSGGFMIQLLPGHTEEDIRTLESNVGQLRSVTDILRSGVTAEDLLAKVLPGAKVLEQKPLVFRCDCSRERLQGVLKSLGKDEVKAIMEEQGGAEIICHFCNEHYWFSKDDLSGVLASYEQKG